MKVLVIEAGRNHWEARVDGQVRGDGRNHWEALGEAVWRDFDKFGIAELTFQSDNWRPEKMVYKR